MLTYGLVINARMAFMIVTFVLYLVARSMHREEEAAAEPDPEPSKRCCSERSAPSSRHKAP